jgi:hypothetical protein
MIINQSKTKGLVFRRPNPRHSLYPDPLAYTDQMHETMLLGVVVNSK